MTVGTRGEPLRIHLFGGFRVVAADREIPPGEWRRRKAAGIVKLLALAPEHRLHREQVLEQLWPDLEPAAADNNLHRTLHVARRTLEPTLATGAAATYLRLQQDLLSLGPPGAFWVDVDAFEAAAAVARQTREPANYRAALALYTGDLLPEDRYEDWTIKRGEELRAQHRQLLMEVARLQAAAGDAAGAIATLQQLVAVEPTLGGDAKKVEAVKGTPILVVIGDNAKEHPRWKAIRQHSVNYHAAFTAAGGKLDLVDLPDAGIKGNSHMMMMDKNSDEIAALIQKWLAEQGLVEN